MRTARRPATLALAATAGLTLAACSTTVAAKPVAAPQSAASEPTGPPLEEAADTGSAGLPGGATTQPRTTAPDSGSSSGTGSGSGSGSGGEDIPEPGAGVPGNEGLCQAVAGWYGYVGLALLATGESGQVDPADVVPLLEALRDAPQQHRDADGDLLDAAAHVSAAADEVVGALRSGTDAYRAIGVIDQPITDFAGACGAAGVDDF
jgi:hypothetical protein